MYRANVYESSKLINSIYIVGIKNYDIECNLTYLYSLYYYLLYRHE